MSEPSRVSALLIVTSSVCTVNAISSGIGTIMGGSHLGWISIVIGLANAVLIISMLSYQAGRGQVRGREFE